MFDDGNPDVPAINQISEGITMNQRFGFYGFFGAIALVLLLTKLTGCSSPAQAEQPRAPRVTVLETIEIVGEIGRASNEHGFTISDVRAVESVTYVIGERTVERDGDTTIVVEPGELTIYN